MADPFGNNAALAQHAPMTSRELQQSCGVGDPQEQPLPDKKNKTASARVSVAPSWFTSDANRIREMESLFVEITKDFCNKIGTIRSSRRLEIKSAARGIP